MSWASWLTKSFFFAAKTTYTGMRIGCQKKATSVCPTRDSNLECLLFLVKLHQNIYISPTPSPSAVIDLFDIDETTFNGNAIMTMWSTESSIERVKARWTIGRNIIKENNQSKALRKSSNFKWNLQDPERRRSSSAWNISSLTMQSQHTWNLKETTIHDSFQMEDLQGHASTPEWFVTRALRIRTNTVFNVHILLQHWTQY